MKKIHSQPGPSAKKPPRTRAEHARGAEGGRDVALVARTLPRRDDVADGGQGQRHETTTAETLDGAEGDELLHRGGEPREHGADHEGQDGDLEDRTPAVEVGDLAPQRGGGRRGQEVRRDHPREVVEAAEVAGDGGQRGGDDALVQGGQEHAGDEAGHDHEDLAVAEVALGVGGHRGSSFGECAGRGAGRAGAGRRSAGRAGRRVTGEVAEPVEEAAEQLLEPLPVLGRPVGQDLAEQVAAAGPQRAEGLAPGGADLDASGAGVRGVGRDGDEVLLAEVLHAPADRGGVQAQPVGEVAQPHRPAAVELDEHGQQREVVLVAGQALAQHRADGDEDRHEGVLDRVVRRRAGEVPRGGGGRGGHRPQCDR